MLDEIFDNQKFILSEQHEAKTVGEYFIKHKKRCQRRSQKA